MLGTDATDTVRLMREFAITKGFSASGEDVEIEIEKYLIAMQDLPNQIATFIDNAKSPMKWWSQIGISEYPTLYKIAKLVFGIPTSQAASERVWSIYDFILTKRRNRLSPATLNTLVQLYVNACVAKRNNLVEIMTGMEPDDVEPDEDDASV